MQGLAGTTSWAIIAQPGIKFLHNAQDSKLSADAR
jgi:hypothetical protein